MSSEFTPSGKQTERATELSASPNEQLDVLGNECSRTILVATQDGPRTAKELTERTDCSSATVYRRINDLLESDLIEECIRFDSGGSHTTAYRATVAELSIAFDGERLSVSVVRSSN